MKITCFKIYSRVGGGRGAFRGRNTCLKSQPKQEQRSKPRMSKRKGLVTSINDSACEHRVGGGELKQTTHASGPVMYSLAFVLGHTWSQQTWNVNRFINYVLYSEHVIPINLCL
jgi:hypothetical protein